MDEYIEGEVASCLSFKEGFFLSPNAGRRRSSSFVQLAGVVGCRGAAGSIRAGVHEFSANLVAVPAV